MIIIFKKYVHTLLKIITNPYLLALLFTSLVISTAPVTFNKYRAGILEKDYDIDNRLIYYVDLNGDGYSEKIIIDQRKYKDYTSIQILDRGKYLDQWNFDGSYIITGTPFWTDLNNDGIQDIFIFLYKDGQIILDCLDAYHNKLLIQNKLISPYEPFNNILDCSINSGSFIYNNKQSDKDYYFVIQTSYSKYPRGVFRYNYRLDTVYSSEISCAAISTMITDKINDNNYFIAATNAYGNCAPRAPLSDRYAWLLMYNSELKYAFKPTKIGVYPSNSSIISYMPGNRKYYVAFNNYLGTEKKQSSLSLYDVKGNIVRRKQYMNPGPTPDASLYYNNRFNSEYFYLIRTDGMIELYDSLFNHISTKSFPRLLHSNYTMNDVDHDGEQELLLINQDLNKMIIARNDFEDIVTIDCDGAGNLLLYSNQLNGSDSCNLFVQYDKYALLISYSYNPYYIFKYPFYAIIYICFVALMLIIQKLQQHRIEIKYKAEKKIAELQIKALKNQIDPHFTLNIINSIGSLIYKQDKDRVDYVFTRYSKLLQSNIINSNQISTPLSTELEYVKIYLELEQFRHNNNFNYTINVDSDVDTDLYIPRMLIHTFVENAIKHGLRNNNNNGHITILIKRREGEYSIIISDNGIGRAAAQKASKYSTGMGLKILDQVLELYYELKSVRILYNISDIKESNGLAGGTEVLIIIPTS